MTGLAALFAAAAAFAFAATSVLQHLSASDAPRGRPLSIRLLRTLTRDRRWLLAIPLDVVGAGCYAVAVHVGSLLFVQLLLILGLVFAVFLRAGVQRRWPGRSALLGAVGSSVGLAVLIVTLRPHGGVDTVSFATAAPALLAVTAAAAACIVGSLPLSGAGRSGLLAAAAGIVLGASGFLLKIATTDLARHGIGVLLDWSAWGVAITGAVGTLLVANAYQTWELPLPLTVLSLVEPLVASVLAVTVLQERGTVHRSDLPALAAVGLLVAGSIVLLSRASAARPSGDGPS